MAKVQYFGMRGKTAPQAGETSFPNHIDRAERENASGKVGAVLGEEGHSGVLWIIRVVCPFGVRVGFTVAKESLSATAPVVDRR